MTIIQRLFDYKVDKDFYTTIGVKSSAEVDRRQMGMGRYRFHQPVYLSLKMKERQLGLLEELQRSIKNEGKVIFKYAEDSLGFADVAVLSYL